MEHRDDRSVGAGASAGNILQGTPFEFAGRRPTAVMVYACTDPPAAGDEGEILMDVLMGTQIVAQNMPVPHFTANLGPNRQDHLVASAVAAPGDRIVVSIRSIAGAAIRTRTLVSFRPV